MLITKDKITELIPQRPPILMIDELVAQDDQQTITAFEIKPDNLFVSDHELEEAGIIENIAQSAAARAGYYYQLHNQKPPLGFIGAISKVIISRYPKVGEKLKTVIVLKSEVFNISLIKGTTFVGETQIAECEMKIVIDDQKTDTIH